MHELCRFLNKWLVGHIMTHDLRFGKWYVEHVAPIAAVEPQQATLAEKAAAMKTRVHPPVQPPPQEKSRGFFAALFGRR